jgi:putative ABC transport system permease protein
VVGLYGVLSYFITRRRNEIGIRIALGAKRGQVISLVMRDTAAMLLTGIVLGTVLALLAGQAATAMLFGLKLLAVIGVLASLLSALEASNLNPVAALRAE